MNRNKFLFTLFLSLAAAAAGGLLFSSDGTPIENVFIGVGLVAIILFAFLAGMMQAVISLQEVRQRGVKRAEQMIHTGQQQVDPPNLRRPDPNSFVNRRR